MRDQTTESTRRLVRRTPFGVPERLLDELFRRGVRFSLDEGGWMYDAPSRLPARLVDSMRRHGAAITAELGAAVSGCRIESWGDAGGVTDEDQVLPA